MPKKEIPDCPKEKPNPAVEDGHSYEIELITPMFGGGVEPRVNDPSFPIRPTTIRGQLQFWWRATVGAKFANLAELRAAQSAIWGSTERASRVQVLVEKIKPDRIEPKPCAEIVWDQQKGRWRTNWLAPLRVQNHPADDSLPYALFPFQGKPEDKKGPRVDPAHCIHQLSFRLIVRCPVELWPQVEPAIWAWANFGGLGGRTRRGCGAVLCKELALRDHAQLAVKMKQFAPQQPEIREWPTVAECVLICEQPGDSSRVWDWLIGRFRHFRQGESLGRYQRQPDSNRPGRSHYPEPELIRRVTKRRSLRHPAIQHMETLDGTPRAELGLPIGFHFPEYQRIGEPEDTFLYPSNGADGKRRDRMASPLILKPLGLADGKAIPLILRLKIPPLSGVDLRRGETSLAIPTSTVIRGERLGKYPNSPLNLKQFADPEDNEKVQETGSALDAFLAFARSEGFTEVSQ